MWKKGILSVQKVNCNLSKAYLRKVKGKKLELFNPQIRKKHGILFSVE